MSTDKILGKLSELTCVTVCYLSEMTLKYKSGCLRQGMLGDLHGRSILPLNGIVTEHLLQQLAWWGCLAFDAGGTCRLQNLKIDTNLTEAERLMTQTDQAVEGLIVFMRKGHGHFIPDRLCCGKTGGTRINWSTGYTYMSLQ